MSQVIIDQLIYGYTEPQINFKTQLIEYPAPSNNNSSSTAPSADLLTFLAQQDQIPWPWVVALAWRFTKKNSTELLPILYRHYAKARINRLFSKGRFALWDIPNDRYVWYSENRYNATEDQVRTMLADFETIRDEIDICLFEHQFFVDKYMLIAAILWTFYLLPEAETFFQALINTRPADADNYYYLAQIAADKGNFVQALDCYHQFVYFAPTSLPNNFYQLNEWFYYLRTYPPNTVDAFVQIALIYLNNYHDINKAMEYFHKAIALRSDDHQALDAYHGLAEQARKIDQWSQSAHYKLKALQVITINKEYWLTKERIEPLYKHYTDLIKLYSKIDHCGDVINAIFDQLTPLVYTSLDLKAQLNYIKLIIDYGSIKQLLIIHNILNDRLQYQLHTHNTYAAKDTKTVLQEFNNVMAILNNIVGLMQQWVIKQSIIADRLPE